MEMDCLKYRSSRKRRETTGCDVGTSAGAGLRAE